MIFFSGLLSSELDCAGSTNSPNLFRLTDYHLSPLHLLRESRGEIGMMRCESVWISALTAVSGWILAILLEFPLTIRELR